MPAADDVWALVAVPLDNLRADAAERPDVPWPERREGLRQELSAIAAGPVVADLLGWLDELSDADRTNLLAGDDFSAYAYQVVTHSAGEAPTDEGYDENAWFAFLTENGGRWDGTAESWDAFREWFVYHATEAGFSAPATSLLDYLRPLAPADRIGMFAQYGVAIQPAATAGTLDPVAQQVMDRLLAAKPQYAEIPEARRVELVTAYLRERESK